MNTIGAALIDTRTSTIVEWLEGHNVDQVRQQARELSLYDSRGGEHLELYVHESSVERFKH